MTRVGRLINIGYGNVIHTDKVLAVVSPDSAPGKRLVQAAKDEGRSIDATQGRKTKGLVVMEGGYVVLSALLPDTIAGRFNEAGNLERISDKEGDDE